MFQKACPSCAALVSSSADRCGCGYSFTAQSQPESTTDAPLSQEDELYVAYLGARVEQARSTLETARAALSSGAGDFAKAVEVMEAVHELRAAREELDAELIRHPEAAALLQNKEAPMSSQPSEEFRAQQAERAAKIMESIQAAVRRAESMQADLRRTTSPGDTEGHDTTGERG